MKEEKNKVWGLKKNQKQRLPKYLLVREKKRKEPILHKELSLNPLKLKPSVYS